MSVHFNYREALQRPEWKWKVSLIHKRDKVCQWCGNSHRLEVHHLAYIKDRLPWEYDNSFLILLCHDCHSKESHYARELKMLIDSKRLNGFSSEEITAIISAITKIKTSITEDEYYYDELMEHIVWENLP